MSECFDKMKIVNMNLDDNDNELSDVLKKRISHVKDFVDLAHQNFNIDSNIIGALLNATDEGLISFFKSFAIRDNTGLVLDSKGLFSNLFDKLILCSMITEGKQYSFGDISDVLFGLSFDNKTKKRVGILHNQQSNDAFVAFASKIRGFEATYEDDFKSLCESITSGKNDYAIIPIRNSSDGRIDSLYKMIFKSSLVLRMLSKVYSDEGEYTYFALIGKSGYDNFDESEVYFEFNISFDEMSSMSEIITATEFFGAKVDNIMTIPDGSGERGAFAFVINVSKESLANLLTFFAIYYPGFVPVGLYHIV